MWKTSINRTILECKEVFMLIGFWIDFVLIEPYWNVKRKCKEASEALALCINRTILECKDYLRALSITKRFTVLIEPYWNVKYRGNWGQGV